MRILFLLVLIISPLHGFSQFGGGQTNSGFDSTGVGRDSSRVQFVGFELTEQLNPDLQRFSYSLDRIQFYQPFYNSGSLVNNSLGNIGTSCYPVTFQAALPAGFASGFRAFDNYFLPLATTQFFDTQSPFTEAFYVQGSQEEAFFRLRHTQNAGKKVNFGLEYQRINSQGYFTSQTAQHSSIRMHSWLRPGNERYQLLFALNYHKGSSLENGGITTEGDSLYKTGTETNRQIYPVNLFNARSDLFNNGLRISHFLDVLKAGIDSASEKRANTQLRIKMNHEYSFRKFTFNETNPDTSFYPFIFDSLRTNSNYTERKFENELALQFFKSSKDSLNQNKTEINVFLKSQLIDFSTNFGSTANDLFGIGTNNISTGGFVKLPLKNSFLFQLNTYYYISGFNKGDYQLNANIRLGKTSGFHYNTGLETTAFEPDFILQKFIGNFNLWNTNPEKINIIKLYSELNYPKYGLSAQINIQNISNYRYLDEFQSPKSQSQSLNLIQVKLTHNNLSYKKWHLQSRVILQITPENTTELIRVPLIQLQESLFREGRIGKSTPYRIGIDLLACSAFTPMAFAPQLGSFYLQSENRSEGLAQLNAYASVKIKRVRFFAMLEHVNSGLFGPQPILVPFYPLPDRLLKLGLSWVFFD
jgi:hypothetical protein